MEDNNDPVTPALQSGTASTPSDAGSTPSRAATVRSGYKVPDEEELDESYNVERSFRITFADGERISFFADTDEQKASWIACFKKVIQNDIPVAPVWATMATDMLKARNGEVQKRTTIPTSQSQSRPQSQTPINSSPIKTPSQIPVGSLRKSVSKQAPDQINVSEAMPTPERKSRPASIAFAPVSAPTPPSSLASSHRKTPSTSTRPISYGVHQSGIPTPTRKPVPSSSSATVGSRPQSMFQPMTRPSPRT